MNMLVWTHEKPTQPGWYFIQHEQTALIHICKVDYFQGELWLHSYERDVHGRTAKYNINSPDLEKYIGKCLWAGPIKEPAYRKEEKTHQIHVPSIKDTIQYVNSMDAADKHFRDKGATRFYTQFQTKHCTVRHYFTEGRIWLGYYHRVCVYSAKDIRLYVVAFETPRTWENDPPLEKLEKE